MQTEQCVVCQIDTKVPVDKPVDARYNYVEGAGQLCKECWNKIYNKQQYGPVAQLGERLICIQEVIGSTPFWST